jgi:multidrug efflux pump subunit AcrB
MNASLLRTLLGNHVLVNLTFILVIVVGTLAYTLLPRQQDPTINFNWISILTVLPGAAALDVERKVTDPLEDAIRKVADVRFVTSNSRPGISSILVRFQDLDERTFDKRISDMRREIQTAQAGLPGQARDPAILEITSANAFPTATVAIVGEAYDENLRIQARNQQKALERISGVSRVDPVGLATPELQVHFDPALLEAHGLLPSQLADTVRAYQQDLAAGSVQVGQQTWLVRLAGGQADPWDQAQRAIVGASGEIPLGQVARVERGRTQPDMLASMDGQPAVLLAVMKRENANTLELLARLQQHLEERNQLAEATGVRLVLVDDQTLPTRQAIGLMQNNALIGLLLVLFVTWFFLGTRIAFLTAIAIPFSLAGTFWVLYGMGETLNVSVLLGVVIVLGMLVDDAVVVVEAIYYRLQRGMDAMTAALSSLREVAAPVFTAVLTTMAAFLPLMLLPGILGDFMRVIPMVVTLALLISLAEAFWILPAHVVAARVSFARPSRMQRFRVRFTQRIRIHYIRILLQAIRRPRLTLLLASMLLVLAVMAVASDRIRVDFFAADTLQLFYVNLQMPPDTPLEQTLQTAESVEARIRALLRPGEARAVVSYAGNAFTETEPLFGDHYGQVLVGLHPQTPERRTVDEIMEALRADVMRLPGPERISFLRLEGGPPTTRPISVKVRGDDYAEIRAAADRLKVLIAAIPGVTDLSDDAVRGRPEWVLRLDHGALQQAGMDPGLVLRNLQLLVDGEIVAEVRDQGDKVEVRVRRAPDALTDLDELLQFRMPNAQGQLIPLAQWVTAERVTSLGNIRHYNFRRAITVEADLLPGELDTVTANQQIQAAWATVQSEFPDIDLDFSGELDDILESLNAIGLLFLFGMGLVYLILGTQFRSYWQPLLILTTVPLAFVGVVAGLLVTGNPLSLYTLYGVVALAGIAVNSAIVLISAANQRLAMGMSLLHATLYAARRRVIPVLITSLTTIAGLFSLATGLGGSSLIWGPVAASIVWGLGFSTLLTLIVIPVLYRLVMGRAVRRDRFPALPQNGTSIRPYADTRRTEPT